MKLPPLKNRDWNYLLLSFLLPFSGVLLLMIIVGCEPFGDRSMLYSDAWHQYYPFFSAYRKALLSGDSLLFSWDVGMGMDYLGLISYYLASPLYLLSVFIPESLTLEYFGMLAPIRIGLAGLFFAIFLKKIFGKDDLSLPLFGAFYATCAWVLGYQWNVMWLDTFSLLPLVALGTVSLLRDKKFFLYTITLFLSVYSNYYIGLFTCIFVLLLFICYQICRCKSFGRLCLDFLRIGVFTVLAIGMTAILELPAFFALQDTQSSVNAFPKGFQMNIADENTWKGLLNAMRQVAGNMGGGLKPAFVEGLPNLYSGVFTVIFLFLFLTTRGVKIRDKLCCVILLLFFMVSFILRQLDYIWHGFHFTNQIPYRFSFLFSFVALYMAYRAFLARKQFRLWQLALAGVLALGIFLCSDLRTNTVFVTYNLVFFTLYMFILGYMQFTKKPTPCATWQEKKELCLDRMQRRSAGGILLAGFMCLEFVMNLVNFGVNFSYTGISNYPHQTDYAASIIRYMKERESDNPFYRAEVTHSKTLNDGALNDYNGISTFTSSANVRVTKFMESLGFAAKDTYNRYCYEESSPVANLFLNLKYLIERDAAVEENSYFDEIHHYGDVYLLENNAYLPLGFLAESELASVDFFDPSEKPFTFQNELFSAATGIQENVWYTTMHAQAKVSGENVTITNSMSTGYSTYECTSSGAYVVYTFDIMKEGLLCLELKMSQNNTFYVYKNDSYLFQESVNLPQVLSVCNVVPGDQITVKVACTAGKNGSITIRPGILREEVFRRGYDVLAASTMELTHFSNALVEGTIDCDRDGLLYTSIPYDGNWFVTLDGKPAEISLVGNAMIGIEVTEGEHQLTFTYRNEAFSIGWKVTLGCAVVFAGLTYIFYFRKRPRYQGKYLKQK